MTTTNTSEASRNGMLTALGAMVGLALGPSVIANLTVTAYITPIEKEFVALCKENFVEREKELKARK